MLKNIKSILILKNEAFKIAFIFFAISLFYILFSDTILFYLIKDLAIYKNIQIYKGFVYVFVSSSIIYLLLKKSFNKIFNELEKNKKLQKKFQDLFYEHNAVKLLIDPENGNIIDANKSAEQFYGYSREELRNKKIYEINTLDKEKIFEEMRNAKELNKNYFEFKHKLKNDEIKDVAVFSAPIINDDNILLYSIIFDISELVQLRNKLKEEKESIESINRLKDSILRNISHEIRTPLNGIIGSAELLIDNTLSYEDKKIYLNSIKISSNRLLCFVDNFILLSELYSGYKVINYNFSSINCPIYDIYDQYLDKCKEKKLNLIYNVDHNFDEKEFYIDSNSIYKIFDLLVDNSLKFTIKGYIEIGYNIINNDDNVVEYYVKDTGIGIKPELSKKIFDSFYQIDNSISRQFEGAGIGLTICKLLIEQMNGKIWYEPIDNGSCFKFIIPLNKNYIKKELSP